MRRLIYTIVLNLAVIFFVSCDGSLIGSSKVNDPNSPSVEQVSSNATKSQIQNLITGLTIRNRQYVASGYNLIGLLGSFGREIWIIDNLEPRPLTQWLGVKGNAENDPTFYATASVYENPYQAIKQANLIMETLKHTNALTESEKEGVNGFVKTIQGFQYLIPLMSQYKNGIRIEVSDPQNLGSFLSYDKAISKIRGILNDAYSDLQNAGNSFFFSLPPGFDNFSNPRSMATLNRAIAARAAIYAKDWQKALKTLYNSKPFFELAKGEEVMNKGAYLSFGNPPDTQNPIYRVPGKNPDNIMVVHPSVIRDTTAGDLRVKRKFRHVKGEPFSSSVLPADAHYADNRFSGVDSPIPMFRNEELILIYAESNMQIDNLQESINAINIIRNTWGLPDYSGSVTKKALIDEILYQRRYSLWAEFGHRWIDMRRYGRLDSIAKNDKIVGKIYKQIARPQSEINK